MNKKKFRSLKQYVSTRLLIIPTFKNKTKAFTIKRKCFHSSGKQCNEKSDYHDERSQGTDNELEALYEYEQGLKSDKSKGTAEIKPLSVDTDIKVEERSSDSSFKTLIESIINILKLKKDPRLSHFNIGKLISQYERNIGPIAISSIQKECSVLYGPAGCSASALGTATRLFYILYTKIGFLYLICQWAF